MVALVVVVVVVLIWVAVVAVILEEGGNYSSKTPPTFGEEEGSYNSGTSQENVSGYNDGHGKVTINFYHLLGTLSW